MIDLSQETNVLLQKILLELQHFNAFNDMDPKNFSHSAKLGWEIASGLAPNLTVAAKANIPWIPRTTYHGSVLYAMGSFSSLKMGLELVFENQRGQILTINRTVEQLIAAGNTVPTQNFYVSKAVATPVPLYVVMLQPTFPGLPFQIMEARVFNSDMVEHTLYSALAIIVRHF